MSWLWLEKNCHHDIMNPTRRDLSVSQDMFWNIVIRVSMAMIMVFFSLEYVFHFENGKFRVNKSRSKLVFGIIFTLISVGYLVYAFWQF